MVIGPLSSCLLRAAFAPRLPCLRIPELCQFSCCPSSPAMATLSQLHLTRAATKLPLPFARTSTKRPLHACFSTSLGAIWRGIGSLRIENARTVVSCISEDSQVQRDGEAEVASSRDGVDSGWFPGVVAAGVLTSAWPAHAVIKDDFEEMMRFSPEAWVNIYISTGVALVIYFLVIPLVVYNYLRLRWYKRSSLETYFQFMLVFVFFPGMLLLAPFINFRLMPKDGTEEP